MNELKSIVVRVEELVAKPSLSENENQELSRLIERGEGLRAEATRKGQAQDFLSATKTGLGGPPLTDGSRPLPPGAQGGGANLLPVRQEAGQAYAEYEVDKKKRIKSLLINDDGEMLIDPATYAMISNPAYRTAFRSYLRNGERDYNSIRVLQEGIDTAGGFLVPEDILTRVVARQPTPTRVAGRVTRLTTTRDSVAMPKVNYFTDDIYTTGIRVTWTGEVPASVTAARVTDPVFGQIRIPIYTAMMTLPLTNNMIEDSSFPIVDYVSNKFQETVDILYDNMVLNGAGNNQPMGILVNPGTTNNPSTIKTGSATLLTADGLVNLAFSLPEQYDMDAVYVFKKTTTGAAIATLKDSNNRYLWGQGLQDSGLSPGWKNRQLLGYDVMLSQLMPDVGAGTFPIIFGDLTGYYLVQRLGFSIQVLRELYAETNQIVLLGRIRLGGMVAEDWKLKVQVVST